MKRKKVTNIRNCKTTGAPYRRQRNKGMSKKLYRSAPAEVLIAKPEDWYISYAQVKDGKKLKANQNTIAKKETKRVRS